MQSKLTILFLLLLGMTGLSAQPTLVKDIFPGDDAGPQNFFYYNGQLLFRAETETEGRELWISDGTEDGTLLVKDINPDPGVSSGNSNPDNYFLYNGLVYFKARDDMHGDELWVTDGTADGTQLVLDIQPGSGNSAPQDFVLFNGLMYFTANDGNSANGSELWVSDGTAGGTMMLVDINPSGSSVPSDKIVLGNHIYFRAIGEGTGSELWRTDGTPEGTELIKDIRDGGNSIPSRFTVYNGEIYFRANDGVNGAELWKTDGTAEGTVMVKDIAPGSSSSGPDNLFVLGDLLYFVADDDVNGDELWVTDGTEEGTQLVLDINPVGSGGPGNFLQILPDFVFFTATDTTHGEELWYISTTEGFLDIDLFEDIDEGNAGSMPRDLVWSGNALYFSAQTAEFGRELYRLSVDDDNVVRISDINTGPENSDINDIFQVDALLFFEATDGVTGDELWKLEIPLARIGVFDLAGGPVMSGDTIDLGDVLVGAQVSGTITLTNTGDATLVLVDNNLADAPFEFNFAFGFLDYETIGVGESEVVEVTFQPVAPGERFFTAVITTEAFNVPVFEIVFRGNAVAPMPAITLTNEAGEVLDLTGDVSIDFGEVIIGQDSTMSFTITSNGNVDLTFANQIMDGAEFSATALPASLAPGSSATLDITFTPSGEGNFFGIFSVNTNDPEIGNFMFDLFGAGVMDTGLRKLSGSEIGIFPNPVGEQLVLRLAETLPEAELMIYDLQGQLLRRLDAGTIHSGFSLDVSALAAGTYLLELRNAEARGVTKFVKQ